MYPIRASPRDRRRYRSPSSAARSSAARRGVTPPLVAGLGATCSRSPRSWETVARQIVTSETSNGSRIIFKQFQLALDLVCSRASRSGAYFPRARPGMGRVQLYAREFSGDAITKLGVFLRGKRFLNLLARRRDQVVLQAEDQRNYQPLQAFGSQAAQGDKVVVFNRVDERFIWATVTAVDTNEAMVQVVPLSSPQNRVEEPLTVHDDLVAPGVQPGHGNPALTGALSSLPPAAVFLVGYMEALLSACAPSQTVQPSGGSTQDTGRGYVSSVLQDCVRAIRATAYAPSAAKGNTLSDKVANLKSASGALRVAMQHLQSNPLGCVSTHVEVLPAPGATARVKQSVQAVMKKSSKLMDLLSCRLQLAHVTGDKAAFLTSDDTHFLQAMLDLLRPPTRLPEGDLALCKGCIELLREEMPALSAKYKIDTGRLDHEFLEVANQCVGDAYQDSIAVRAKRQDTDASAWEQAAEGLKKRNLNPRCSAAVNNLLVKIRNVKCTGILRDALPDGAAHGAAPPKLLAEMVMQQHFSQPAASSLPQNPQLAKCLLELADPKSMDLTLKNRLRTAATAPSGTKNEEAVARAVEENNREIHGEQMGLTEACSKSIDPENPLDYESIEKLVDSKLLLSATERQEQGLSEGLYDVQREANAIVAKLKLVPHSEKQEERNKRNRCLEVLEEARVHIEKAVCRNRLMSILHRPGNSLELERAWRNKLRSDRENNVEPHADAPIAEACARLLDNEGHKRFMDTMRVSSRACDQARAQALTLNICTSALRKQIPVTTMDFLALVGYASLPAWPIFQTQKLDDEWLRPRRETFSKEPHAPTCELQEHIIEAHTTTNTGKEEKATTGPLHQDIEKLVKELENHSVTVANLHECACSSPKVQLSSTQLEEIARIREWYRYMGDIALPDRNEDLVNNARVKIAEDIVLAYTTYLFRWAPTATWKLGYTPFNKNLYVHESLWRTYLGELMLNDGSLRKCMDRFEEKYKGEEEKNVCLLAAVDSFFYVILFDLLSIADEKTNLLDKVASKISYDRDKLKTVARSGALVAAGTALTLAGGTSLSTLLQAFGVQALNSLGTTLSMLGAVQPPHWLFAAGGATFIHGLFAKPILQFGISLYNFASRQFTVEGAANVMLARLCERAMKQHDYLKQTTRKEDYQSVSNWVRMRSKRWNEIQDKSEREAIVTAIKQLPAPGFYPVAPPGLTSPAPKCSGGMC